MNLSRLSSAGGLELWCSLISGQSLWTTLTVVFASSGELHDVVGAGYIEVFGAVPRAKLESLSPARGSLQRVFGEPREAESMDWTDQ